MFHPLSMEEIESTRWGTELRSSIPEELSLSIDLLDRGVHVSADTNRFRGETGHAIVAQPALLWELAE